MDLGAVDKSLAGECQPQAPVGERQGMCGDSQALGQLALEGTLCGEAHRLREDLRVRAFVLLERDNDRVVGGRPKMVGPSSIQEMSDDRLDVPGSLTVRLQLAGNPSLLD